MSAPDVTIHDVKKLAIDTELVRSPAIKDVFNITRIVVYTSNGVAVNLRLFHNGGLNIISGQEL